MYSVTHQAIKPHRGVKLYRTHHYIHPLREGRDGTFKPGKRALDRISYGFQGSAQYDSRDEVTQAIDTIWEALTASCLACGDAPPCPEEFARDMDG